MLHRQMIRILLTACLLCSAPLWSGETSNTGFLEKTDYTRISAPAVDMPDIVLVFRYGSESSYRLYRILSERNFAVTLWPAVFRESWRPEAKLALMANQLQASTKQQLALFESLHQEPADWSQLTAYRQLLSKVEFKAESVEPVLFDSELPKRLKHTQMRIKEFSISTVPTIIFKGQYTINADQAKTPARLIDIIQHLEQLTQ